MPNRAVAALVRVLAPLGPIADRASGSETELELGVAGARYVFRVKWAGDGFPEDVRRVLATLPEAAPAPGEPTTVVAARRLSVGARKLLRERQLSWVDESRAAHIVATPGLLVDHDGDPKPTSQSRRWSWSAAASAVAELVLAGTARPLDHPKNRTDALPPAAEFARRAGVSVSAVNTTLRAWAGQGWVEKRGGQRGPTSTRLLVAPGELLSSWAAWTASTPASQLAIDADVTDAITWVQTELAAVMPRKGTWCLGGAVASELTASRPATVSQVLCHVERSVFTLLHDSLERSGAALATSDHARLLLRAAPQTTVALASQGPVPLASGPRIYADLVAAGGADSQGATHFRRVALGF